MDDLDHRLLALLRQDARAAYTELARDLELSEGAIRGRVHRLVEDGVIERFTIETRRAGLHALLEVSVRLNVEARKVAEHVLGLEGVDRVMEISGDTDFVAEVLVADAEALNEVIDAVRRTGNVEATRTSLVLKQHHK